MFLKAAAVLEGILGSVDYLVGDRFSITDIIVGFTVSWADMQHLLEELPNLQSYLARLKERPDYPG